MSRAWRSAGFTLLELLLAIGLSLLLSLLAYGGLQLGIRSWEAVDRQLQQGEQRYLS
jgi:prepilin-type N-terminal cleavage/methylation domain-containing protein